MAGIGDFARQNPDVLKGLSTIEAAAGKSAKLEPKMHELIALAVAVTTRCDGCIAVHTQKAVEHGASREEIAEALGVCRSGAGLFRTGAGSTHPTDSGLS